MLEKTIIAALVIGLVACDRNEQPVDKELSPGAEKEQSAREQAPKPDEEQAKKDQLADQEFVKKAASGGMFEVKSSRHALEQQESLGPLKSFAEEMIKDHEKANEELKSLAEKKNWTVPSDLLPKHAKMMTAIENAEGDLEKVYREKQMKAHEEDIKLFEKCKENCNDPQLKAFAERTLKVIKDHHEQLQNLSGRAQK